MTDHERPDLTVRRSYQIYLYVVCFVSIVVVLFAGAVAAYGLFKVAIPGALTEGPADAMRKEGAAQVIQSGILTLVALVIFLFHWNRAVEVRAELERLTAPPPPPPVAEPPAEYAPPPARPRPRPRRAPPPTAPPSA